ncbi:DNA mismatch repair endonuclease MutL [Gangjinia marincola]|uniref:DNA mismatch repair protein MutL n=1 Tax=Gangjinia marincola TaxID=578463 RepID=A0ABP3XUQ5_9FLAO
MSDIIKLLPDHVANQIAAGEVVQRPSSVVKELLENAIDAGATTIKLLIKEAGKVLIQVIDNGKGLSETDARMAFERHATSKINQAEDLFKIQSKGFRGEALASIAAVAHVELKTKQENEETGTCITIEGSKVISQEVCVTPKGTVLSVKNLFFNIPARRNFLKSDAVETRHIIDEFHRVALAHPEISFTMLHNGNEVFRLPASNQRQRIVNVFGIKTNEKLVPVEEETDVVKIKGFVGKPEFAKRTRGEQFFFVNDRFIKSPYLNHAVSAAFEGLLNDKVHPRYFLYLSVDPQRIDINIHPTKTEIKFDDEHALYAMLRSTIKHSLGQFNVAPVLDFDRDAGMEVPYQYKNKHVIAPVIEVDHTFNPFAEDNGGVKVNVSSKTSTGFKHDKREPTWDALYSGIQAEKQEQQTEASTVTFETEEVNSSIFTKNTAPAPEATVFQLQRKFIVTTVKNGMLVIDQHRAHTRILYEELLKNITVSTGASQQLLFPLSLPFSGNEIGLIVELKPMLEQTGFLFGEIANEQVEVKGIPTMLTEGEVPILLEKLLSDFQQEVPDAGFEQTDLLARSLADSMAVRNGTLLAQEEQLQLVNRLFACKETLTTPSNKQIFITLTAEQLERKF